jgi:hypothetical protein
VKHIAGQGIIKGLGSKPLQQCAVLDTAFGPEHAAKAPGIMKSQGFPGIQYQVNMIMFFYQSIRWHDAKAARHAQVNHQRTMAEVQQNVLGTPTN